MMKIIIDLIMKLLVIYDGLSFLYFILWENPTAIYINMAINIIINIISLIIVNKKYQNIYKKVEKFDYYRGLELKDIKPLEAGKLISKNNLGFNSFLIIIYELADEGIIKMEYSNNDTYISLKENISKNDIDELPIEKSNIIKIIFDSSSDTNKYELKQIIENIKKCIGKSTILNDTLKKLNGKINGKYYYAAYTDFLFEETGAKMLEFATVLGMILPLIAIAPLIGISSKLTYIIPITLYIMDALILIIWLNKRYIKLCYMKEINKLNGLYNFLSDFSNIKNLPLEYAEIYDKYYLYAISFGLAEKMEQEYKINSVDMELSKNLKYLLYDVDGQNLGGKND